MKRLLLLCLFATAAYGQTTCVFVFTPALKLECVAPTALGVTGPAGKQGPQGPAGPQGPQGPPGPSASITGGPCTSPDGKITMFVQLPDQTCLPIIVTGSFTVAGNLVDTDGKPIPLGTLAKLAGAVNIPLAPSGNPAIEVPVK